MHTTDVLIVGGGIVGLGTALALAGRTSVTVVEAEKHAAGAELVDHLPGRISRAPRRFEVEILADFGGDDGLCPYTSGGLDP